MSPQSSCLFFDQGFAYLSDSEVIEFIIGACDQCFEKFYNQEFDFR